MLYVAMSPVTAGNISLINNIVTGNQIEEPTNKGGGIFAQLFSNISSVGEIVFLNNTVTANRSDGNGAGAYLFAGSGDESGDISVYNSIIRGNEGGWGADIYINCPDGNADFYFNDCHDRQGTWPNASDNIDKDPCFVSPGSWDENGTPADTSDDIWITGNYHLKPDSPCIDAGLLSRKKFFDPLWVVMPYGPENDFEGDPRSDDWHKISNDEYRKYCDMGADEFILQAMPWLPLILFD